MQFVGSRVRSPHLFIFNLWLRFENPRQARQRFVSLNHNAACQLFQGFRRRSSFDLRPIFPFVRVARMQQLFVQFRFIAQ